MEDDDSTKPSDEEMKESKNSSSEEPDVLISVGGIEFWEYRQTLRSWSGFFDALFRSGMKEASTKRVEFADKDPEEWELISALVAPLSSKRVTKDNVLTVLPWFHELFCPRGVEQCEEVLVSLVTSFGDMSDKAERDTLFDITVVSLHYGLKAQESCLSRVKEVIADFPHLLNMADLQLIIDWMLNHDEAKRALWPVLIPLSLASFAADNLLRQELLPLLLHSEIQRSYALKTKKEAEAKLNETESTLVSFKQLVRSEVSALADRTSNADLRPRLRTFKESLW